MSTEAMKMQVTAEILEVTAKAVAESARVRRGLKRAWDHLIPQEIMGFCIDVEHGLKAAFAWLAEHPIVPTTQQLDEINRELDGFPQFCQSHAIEWQRLMFLAPDPDGSIKDLLNEFAPEETMAAQYNANVREAYRRGKEGR